MARSGLSGPSGSLNAGFAFGIAPIYIFIAYLITVNSGVDVVPILDLDSQDIIDSQALQPVFHTFCKHNMLLPNMPAPLPVDWLKRLGINDILRIYGMLVGSDGGQA
jgi:hypothetical protein